MASKNRLTVTLADGEELTVLPTLEDRLAFETALRKNKGWGKLEDNAMKLLPFLAWNALTREGRTALAWEEFTTGKTAAIAVEPAAEPDEDDEELEVPGVGKDTPTAPSHSSLSYSPETTEAPLGNGAENPAHA